MSSSVLILIFTGAVVLSAPKDAKDPWHAYLIDMGNSHSRLLRIPIDNVDACLSPCKDVKGVCQCSLAAGDLKLDSLGANSIGAKKNGLPDHSDYKDIKWLLRMSDLDPAFKVVDAKGAVRSVFNWTSAETCAFDEVVCLLGTTRKVYEIEIAVDGKKKVRQALPELVAFKVDLVKDTIQVPIGTDSAVELKLKNCAGGCPLWLSNMSAGSGGGGGSCLPFGLLCEEKSESHIEDYWTLGGTGAPAVAVERMCGSSVSLWAKQSCSHVLGAPLASASTAWLINEILEEFLGRYNWWTVGDRIICPPVLVE